VPVTSASEGAASTRPAYNPIDKGVDEAVDEMGAIESAPSTQLAIKKFTAFFIGLLPFSDRSPLLSLNFSAVSKKGFQKEIITTCVPALAWCAYIYFELRGKLSNIKGKLSTVKDQESGLNRINPDSSLSSDFWPPSDS
jgi:hypothetical protein